MLSNPSISNLLKSCQLLHSLLIIIIISSCSTTRNSAYFQTLLKDTTLQSVISNTTESKIQKKDEISVTISSLNKELDDQFNAAALTFSGNAVNQQARGYVVNEQGNILLHILGTVRAEGLTRRELQEKLQEALLPYMKEPIVVVQYLNHKVTVMGEIANPSVLNMPNERLSLIDVIIASGDVKENANRSDIVIIRDTADTEKIIKHINLEDHSIFTSPWYYVRPNDIVYVTPNRKKTDSEEKKRNFQATLSLLASGISLLVILINTLIK